MEAPQVLACPSTGRSGGARAGAEQEGHGVGPKRGVGHTLSHLARVRVRVRGLESESE